MLTILYNTVLFCTKYLTLCVGGCPVPTHPVLSQRLYTTLRYQGSTNAGSPCSFCLLNSFQTTKSQVLQAILILSGSG